MAFMMDLLRSLAPTLLCPSLQVLVHCGTYLVPAEIKIQSVQHRCVIQVYKCLRAVDFHNIAFQMHNETMQCR